MLVCTSRRLVWSSLLVEMKRAILASSSITTTGKSMRDTHLVPSKRLSLRRMDERRVGCQMLTLFVVKETSSFSICIIVYVASHSSFDTCMFWDASPEGTFPSRAREIYRTKTQGGHHWSRPCGHVYRSRASRARSWGESADKACRSDHTELNLTVFVRLFVHMRVNCVVGKHGTRKLSDRSILNFVSSVQILSKKQLWIVWNCQVDIYEARSFIGGKVGSYVDKQGNHIEMGLHVFFGCYNNLFRLLTKVWQSAECELWVPFMYFALL